MKKSSHLSILFALISVAFCYRAMASTEMVSYTPLDIKLRTGVFFENRDAKFRGCILYLQGLADSISNHQPYFSKLNNAGFRVITFDYMGQGGSEGSMNNTAVEVKTAPNATEPMLRRHRYNQNYEIQSQAEYVWDFYESTRGPNGHDCSNSKKYVIGWSTGGLAAYRMAFERRAHAVVLIAPGIHPKLMVGESAYSYYKMVLFMQTITERSLTRNKFANQNNPHQDPIKPLSPAHVPSFAGNLVLTSMASRYWDISREVPGLVFLSGNEDTYVSRTKTFETLLKRAPHFTVTTYDGALHELDNEIPEVANDLHDKTIMFFTSISLGQ